MLQQTQVARVIPKFKLWMKEFPTVQSLAKASTYTILRTWQGLGYNRRALFLKKGAQYVLDVHKGKLPEDILSLKKIPGIGEYTANAIRAFAFNLPSVCIETNIRTVFVHHFFSHKKIVSDEDIKPLLLASLVGISPRFWYGALMDYGSYLKQTGIQINCRTKGYVKQKSFKGSVREVRGRIVRYLSSSSGFSTIKDIEKNCHKFDDVSLFEKAIEGLVHDGIVFIRNKKIYIVEG